MRLLLINTDRNVFTSGSAVRQRLSLLKGGYIEAIDGITFSLTHHELSGDQEVVSGIHIYPTDSYSRLLYGFDAIRIAKKLPRPDVVSAQDPFETGLAALCIARYFGVPLVVEMHTDFLSPTFLRHSFLNRIRVHIAGFVLRRAAAGYAVSEHIKKSVEKKYAPTMRIDVLPIFVDAAKFASLLRTPQKNSLLWVGRFTAEKEPAFALYALAHARVAGYAAHLTMLGTGPLEMQLHALAKRLGIEAQVTFAGWGDPAAYLPQAELVLATSRYEGYGMSIVEALAAGVPVLSTDVGVAREAGAVIAASNTREGYAQALLTWLGGPRARGTLHLATYANEQEYIQRIRALYASRTSL